MVPIVVPDDIHALDLWCCASQGIDPADLMERASQSVTKAILTQIDALPADATILVAAGPGNNGGDGLCVARMLYFHRQTLRVVVTHVSADGPCSPLRRWANEQLPAAIEVMTTTDAADRLKPDVIIDAIMGIGGTEELRETIADALVSLSVHDVIRIALDVPTGLNPMTGIAHATAFRADTTITISAEKRGFWLNDGPDVTGRVVVVPLGVDGAEERLPSSVARYTSDDCARLLPQRARRYSKFDAGRVVVVGGTTSMHGAPSMAAHAALRVGAGLVHLAAPIIHPMTPREVITHALPHHDDGSIAVSALSELDALVRRASVVVVGPGLGMNSDTLHMLASVIESLDQRIPIIIDADGLRLLPLLSAIRPSMVLTPHRGEFARMLGVDARDLSTDVMALAHEWCQTHAGVLHLKDTPSVTQQADASVLTVNGTPRMATAGAGDILTGMIAGVVAQGVSTFEGTALASYLHAQAGVYASGGKGDRPIVATDMLWALPHVMAHSLST
jgi:hydroxyethylthiazole kinase-like uncharacterized protein yjeF